MALATLCRDISPDNGASLTGLIVDHQLRRNSGIEALRVAHELQRLGIEPFILKLNWAGHGNPGSLSNMETAARRLRYQALGKACYTNGINTLLVGHHADDQAETVMLRCLTGYLGDGLQGIRPRARLPECPGIYGVDGSGTPRLEGQRGLGIEDGGVSIIRPLLPFTKDDLIGVCREASTKWFEDGTNADSTLTLRNTVRFLQKQSHLPAALQRPRLVAVAEKVRDVKEEIEEQAEKLFNAMPVELDVRRGMVTFSVRDGHFDLLSASKRTYHVQAVLLRRLLQLASPATDISLHDLDGAVDMVFGKTMLKSHVQIAGVEIHRDAANNTAFSLHRSAPPAKTCDHVDQALLRPADGSWTDWRLWDNRYWVRVQYPAEAAGQPETSLLIRFLTSNMVGSFRKSLGVEGRSYLDEMLKPVSARVRRTLPVLVGGSRGQEEVVALPTLQGAEFGDSPRSRKRGIKWEVRYKNVRIAQSEMHRILR